MAQKEKKRVDKKTQELEKEVEKISKEVEKNEKKKDTKKKDNKKKEEKPEIKKESWWHSVKAEFKKVRWPSKKEMIKYSVATIVFILFFAALFSVIELVAWLIKTM